MASISLQFRGVENAQLLTLLGWAIALALVGYGLWQLLYRRQRRGGIRALAAAGLAGAMMTALAVRVPLEGAKATATWLVVLAMIIAMAVGVFYSAVYGYLGRRRIAVLLALRLGAILALLLILFKPAISIPPAAAGRKLALQVLVDRSASMDTIDHADLPNRFGRAVGGLLAQQDRLDKNFRPGWSHFATAVRQVDDLDELADVPLNGPDCEVTDIAAALRSAAAAYGPDESAGIVLITDGLHNGPGDPTAAAGETLVPVYVIGIGSRDERAAGRRNVRLLAAEAPLEAVQENVTTVTARIQLTGWANISSRVVLREGDQEVASRQITADRNSQELTVELNWTPSAPPAGLTGADIRKLTVAVEPNPAEATAADNAAELSFLITQPSVRVLYIEGTLRPEYKFLRRILAGDPNVKLISMARYADNRFLSQGNIDGKRLTDLPRSDEEFAFFDLIILGDLDRTFLTNDQMDHIRNFVSNGKALLMLGGRSSFGPGGYGGTAIEAALPVTCGGRTQPQETTPFVPQLTAAGAVSPIFAGIGKHFGSPDGDAAEGVPELLGCVTVPAARPGATVLAIHPTRRNAAGPLVTLAVHHFGSGRAAAFTADTTWRWFLKLRPLGGDNPYHRFWGQLVRYLAGIEQKTQQAGSSVLVRTSSAYVKAGEKLKITAHVRGPDGQAEEGATVSAVLAAEGAGEGFQLPLPQAESGAGVYEADHAPAEPGTYTLTVSAMDAKGARLGSDKLTVTVAAHSKETERLARNDKLLKAIAEAGRGRYDELAAMPDVIDRIIARQAGRLRPAPRATEYGLYNFARVGNDDSYDFLLLFIVFVALLTAEWLIRRRWQLQ